MAAIIAKCFLFASLLCFAYSIEWDISTYFKNKKVTEAYEPRHSTNSSHELCSNGPEGGLEWLVFIRDPEYGWGEDTARAVITLVVSNWTMNDEQEVDDIKLQLNADITKALLWNSTKPIQSIDLALYIQALVAIGKNPHDFYGFDLVADLLHRVNSPDPHPMLVLALCDVNSVDLSHLVSIRKHLERPILSRTDADLKAMALKAFACAASLDPYLGKFKVYMVNAANSLIHKQKEDKSFGNLYSTALIVQALIASNFTSNWDMDGALEYIHRNSLSEQSVMGIYYCELALKAYKHPFVKDIYPGRFREYTSIQRKFGHGSRLHYTVRNNLRPNVHFTITIHVPKDSDFFNVMKLSALEDSNFVFSHYLDSDNRPVIYAMNGIPNNPEENYYWRLCRQQRVHDSPQKSTMRTVHQSPILENANESHHFIMWYRDTICERDSH